MQMAKQTRGVRRRGVSFPRPEGARAASRFEETDEPDFAEAERNGVDEDDGGDLAAEALGFAWEETDLTGDDFEESL